MTTTTDDAPAIQIEGRRVVVRMTDQPGSDENPHPRFAWLRRPTMVQLAAIYDLAIKADDALPEPRQVDLAAMDAAELVTYQAEVNALMIERNRKIHTESPHGHAFVEIVNMLQDVVWTIDDVDPYFMQPRATAELLRHWDAPLGGPAPDDANATSNGVAPSALDVLVAASQVATPSLPPGTGDSSPSDPVM